MRTQLTALLAHLALSGAVLRADDWPQFRGLNRDGIWHESGIMQTFPKEGLHVAWRAPAGTGLSSPVVAHGRVYLHDAKLLEKPKAHERIHCFDEKTGQVIWSHEYELTYPDWAFDPTQSSGPNATPVVHEGKIYCFGAMGDLICLDAIKGSVLWQKNFMREYGTKEFTGITPSPLIEDHLLILAAGIQPDACVIAFDKDSGKEVWRALGDPWTYSSPVAFTAGGQRQMIVWTPKAINSLNPATGATWWREELDTANNYGVAPAVRSGERLLMSGLMFQLDASKPAATVLWPENRVPAKVVLSSSSIPIIQDDGVYTGKYSGQLVCLDLQNGKEIWSTDKITSRGNGATIHLTPNGGTVLLFTDQGNLIRARLSREGYHELSRVHVIDPTYTFSGRKLIWPPPAYANGHILARNDVELIRASLTTNP
jgi:outer membrane protein assembly factor BamB